MTDPEIRGTVQRAIVNTEKAASGLFERAVARGELPVECEPPGFGTAREFDDP